MGREHQFCFEFGIRHPGVACRNFLYLVNCHRATDACGFWSECLGRMTRIISTLRPKKPLGRVQSVLKNPSRYTIKHTMDQSQEVLLT